jgi:hypothetical protein
MVAGNESDRLGTSSKTNAKLDLQDQKLKVKEWKKRNGEGFSGKVKS